MEEERKRKMNETIRTLTERRSTRSYEDRHVSKAELDQIVEAGLHAPSGMNRQTPRLVVVSDDAMVKKLSAMNAAVLGSTGDPFYGARDLIIVLSKKEGTYLYDGSLAMGNLLNAAWSLGIGCCWIHRAKEVFESEEGKRLLHTWGVDEEVEGIGFCILGYEKEGKARSEIKAGRVYYVCGEKK